MGAGMKRAREEKPVPLALSLTTDSPTTSTMSADLFGSPASTQQKKARRGRVVATSGEGEFVCKTCSRAFASFQALGGHRTSHMRGRHHGLELGVGVAKAITIREKKQSEDRHQGHECHICGLGFETGQALGGHMRRHREEMAPNSGADQQWVWRSVALLPDEYGADHQLPVLLELFV
ncbi:unnamed protein product [Alopecurus aequalis]